MKFLVVYLMVPDGVIVYKMETDDPKLIDLLKRSHDKLVNSVIDLDKEVMDFIVDFPELIYPDREVVYDNFNLQTVGDKPFTIPYSPDTGTTVIITGFIL